MKTILLAAVLAGVTVVAGSGCRHGCNDCPSRSYRYVAPPAVVVEPSATVVPTPAN